MILLEIEPTGGTIEKMVIYANSEILAAHDGDHQASRVFYLHDRLGSVRMIIDDQAAVKNHYTYDFYGKPIATECTENTENNFKFTGQRYDDEIGWYYLRARMYDPELGRFVSRDSYAGEVTRPLSLHKYLYCENDSLNRIDPWGLWTFHMTGSFHGVLLKGITLQGGLVIDGKGNIGLMGVAGHGMGGPVMLSGGISFGKTNAETIFDLRGAGSQIGGSVTVGKFSLGVELLHGYKDDTRQELTYTGWEITPGLGWPSFKFEGHAFETTTAIKEFNNVDRKAVLGVFKEQWEEGLSNVRTVGQGYLYLLSGEIIDALSYGSTSYMERVEKMGL